MNARGTAVGSSVATFLALSAAAWAIAVPDGGSPAAEKAFRSPLLAAEPLLAAPAALDGPLASAALADLAALGLDPETAFLDVRGGTWATLLAAMPLVPGDGVGNALTWEALGFPAAPAGADLGEVAWQRLLAYLQEHESELRIDPAELLHRVTVHQGGNLIQVHAQRQLGGLPVRDTRLTAVINHGNLVLLGTDKWAATGLSPRPLLPAEQAVGVLAAHLSPLRPDGYRAEPALTILPAASAAEESSPYQYRLAWVLAPQFRGDLGTWEGLVDAHGGELLAFVDTNHYTHARNVKGGVYPVSNDGAVPDGVEQAGWPMPFANVTGDISTFTDSGGNVSGVSGTMTTTLNGQFVRITDTCGAVNESSATVDGDLDLETSAGDDCTVPAGHSAGDTHSARSGFFELNRIKEQGRGHLPANAWLQAQLTANMNINEVCNAFWDGFSVNFFRSGGGCANTGEIAGVFDHEWGHGLDNNDANGQILFPGSEGIADIYAALRLNTSCIGRGFFLSGNCSGYGDPCLDCSGIRDIDWEKHVSGQPHDIDWGQANCGGFEVHCAGYINGEATWDLHARDLPATYGYDANTALEIATRLNYLGANNTGAWFSTSGGCETGTGCGCSASSGYMQYLAADDDNGNTGDGTPHMNAIFDAFDRHQIACTTPTVQDGGCASVPTQAPVVAGSGGDTTAHLTWAAIPNATRYKVYRADGVFQCDFGKQIVGEVAAADGGTFSFDDSGLQNGREYYYVVAGLTSSDACVGPMSDCTTVQAGALFADGFESGDTSEWDTTTN